MKRVYFLLLCVAFFCATCNTIDVYEQTKAFPDHAWSQKDKLSFTFKITDTSSAYNVFAVVRHTDAYHFNNIWVNITTQQPGGAYNEGKQNLKLADDAQGWLGTAMDDVIEQRILLTPLPIHLHAGNYTVTIQQIMREEPLQNMLNAGIRVEKATE